MQRVATRISLLVTACFMVWLVYSGEGNAQDPPLDDPIMRAILERAVLTPNKTPNTSETLSKPSGKVADRWRIAERLLRQARILERDAESLQQLGDTDAADALRQLAATTREQVVRILPQTAKPLEEKRELKLPLKTTIP